MKVIIAIDSFKGSLSSLEAGLAVKAGIFKSRPDADIVIRPLADGGEGTTDALIDGLGGKRIDLTVTDDVKSAPTKAKQFGFTMQLKNGKKFTCVGDEPYNAINYEFVKGSDWLLHEAFCLYGEADKFKPYEKHHSTVKEACQLAKELGVPNLLLYHTEETHLTERKKLYTEEGKKYYHGNLYVPDDLETFEL